MDSLINRYTADKRLRSDDAYTPGGQGGKRPDRAVLVYSQRCREAFPEVPLIIGGIEASLRRIAQYDYWSDAVRRSILVDSGADLLLYGNAERAIAEVAHRLGRGERIGDLTDIRGTAVVRRSVPAGWTELDSTRIDWPKDIDSLPNPYAYGASGCSHRFAPFQLGHQLSIIEPEQLVSRIHVLIDRGQHLHHDSRDGPRPCPPRRRYSGRDCAEGRRPAEGFAAAWPAASRGPRQRSARPTRPGAARCE